MANQVYNLIQEIRGEPPVKLEGKDIERAQTENLAFFTKEKLTDFTETINQQMATLNLIKLMTTEHIRNILVSIGVSFSGETYGDLLQSFIAVMTGAGYTIRYKTTSADYNIHNTKNNGNFKPSEFFDIVSRKFQQQQQEEEEERLKQERIREQGRIRQQKKRELDKQSPIDNQPKVLSVVNPMGDQDWQQPDFEDEIEFDPNQRTTQYSTPRITTKDKINGRLDDRFTDRVEGQYRSAPARGLYERQQKARPKPETRRGNPFANIDSKGTFGQQGVRRPINYDVFGANDVKRKRQMETPEGYEMYRRRYMAEHGGKEPPLSSAFDETTGNFVIFNDANGDGEFQPGDEDAKYINGYYLTPPKFALGDQEYERAKYMSKINGEAFNIGNDGKSKGKQVWLKEHGFKFQRVNKHGFVIPESTYNGWMKKFGVVYKALMTGDDDASKARRKQFQLMKLASEFYKQNIATEQLLQMTFDKYGVTDKIRAIKDTDIKEYNKNVMKAKSSDYYKTIVAKRVNTVKDEDIREWIISVVREGFEPRYKPIQLQPSRARPEPRKVLIDDYQPRVYSRAQPPPPGEE
jgi:hypothetical protein